jgi:hypothetical protein
VDSGSWVLGPNPIGLVRGLGIRGPRPIGLALGLGLLAPGSAANRTRPWIRTPGSKPDRALPWTRTLGSKANRTRRSSALKSDSGLDSGSVCLLGWRSFWCPAKLRSPLSPIYNPKSTDRWQEPVHQAPYVTAAWGDSGAKLWTLALSHVRLRRSPPHMAVPALAVGFVCSVGPCSMCSRWNRSPLLSAGIRVQLVGRCAMVSFWTW